MTIKDQADNVVWEAPIIGYEQDGHLHIDATETEQAFLMRLRELSTPEHKLSWEKAWKVVVPNTVLLLNPGVGGDCKSCTRIST